MKGRGGKPLVGPQFVQRMLEDDKVEWHYIGRRRWWGLLGHQLSRGPKQLVASEPLHTRYVATGREMLVDWELLGAT